MLLWNKISLVKKTLCNQLLKVWKHDNIDTELSANNGKCMYYVGNEIIDNDQLIIPRQITFNKHVLKDLSTEFTRDSQKDKGNNFKKK